jgi:hypothetical protein
MKIVVVMKIYVMGMDICCMCCVCCVCVACVLRVCCVCVACVLRVCCVCVACAVRVCCARVIACCVIACRVIALCECDNIYKYNKILLQYYYSGVRCVACCVLRDCDIVM